MPTLIISLCDGSSDSYSCGIAIKQNCCYFQVYFTLLHDGDVPCAPAAPVPAGAAPAAPAAHQGHSRGPAGPSAAPAHVHGPKDAV